MKKYTRGIVLVGVLFVSSVTLAQASTLIDMQSQVSTILTQVQQLPSNTIAELQLKVSLLTGALGLQQKVNALIAQGDTVERINGKLSPQTRQISLPKSELVLPITQTPTFTKIEGLSSIRIGGGSWDNWDSDVEKDGPVVDVVYLNSTGEIITTNTTTKMPITADVKIYAKPESDILSSATKLVYSSHYNNDQIILGRIYPAIRIAKEQISINRSADYKYGAVEVTIHTPEQGDFSDRRDFIALYEN